MKFFLICFLVLFISACFGKPEQQIGQPDLKNESPPQTNETGVAKKIAKVLALEYALSATKRVELLKDIKAVLAKNIKNQTERDDAIRNAVKKHSSDEALVRKLKKVIDGAHPIKKAVDDTISNDSPPPDALLSLIQSNLDQVLYELIRKHWGSTDKQKNAIMVGVKLAMESYPKDSAKRNQAIDAAIASNGNFTALGTNLKARVDVILGPDASRVVLLTQPESGLYQGIYDVIANYQDASNAEKNAIMKAAKEAMEKYPKDEVKRNRAIDDAVANNGHHKDLADTIKSLVGIELFFKDWSALGVMLMKPSETRLPKNVYDVVANFPKAGALAKNTLIKSLTDIIDVYARPEDKAARDRLIESEVSKQMHDEDLAKFLIREIDVAIGKKVAMGDKPSTSIKPAPAVPSISAQPKVKKSYPHTILGEEYDVVLEHQALKKDAASTGTINLVFKKSKTTVGSAQFELNYVNPLFDVLKKDDHGKQKTLYVSVLQTINAPPNASKLLITYLAKLAKDLNVPITLSVAWGAGIFWAKMGFIFLTPNELVDTHPSGVLGPIVRKRSIDDFLESVKSAIRKKSPGPLEKSLIMPLPMVKQWASISDADLKNFRFPDLNYEKFWVDFGADAAKAKNVANALRQFKKADIKK